MRCLDMKLLSVKCWMGSEISKPLRASPLYPYSSYRTTVDQASDTSSSAPKIIFFPGIASQDAQACWGLLAASIYSYPNRVTRRGKRVRDTCRVSMNHEFKANTPCLRKMIVGCVAPGVKQLADRVMQDLQCAALSLVSICLLCNSGNRL